MDDEGRWIELIKSLRAAHGIDIFEAHKLAAAMPEWRRWVERRINTDVRCRRQALRHIRDHGAAGLLEERDGRLVVR